MAKMITRTITVYTYTTGKLDFTTMKVKEVKNFQYPYKLGSRAKKELAEQAGNPIIAETTGETLYGMTLDDFLKYAKPVSKEEADESDKEIAEVG